MFDLKNELTFHHILDAFLTWALHHWRESLATDCLIDFKSACIAGIHSNLHAWFHITASGYNTFDGHHSTYLICLDVSHSDEVLLGALAWSDLDVVAPLELWGNALVLSLLSWLDKALLDHVCRGLGIVLPSLLHKHIKCGVVFWSEFDTWLWHVGISHLREKPQVPRSVGSNSVQEALVSS